MDLASLQNELKAAKEKWDDVKLGKAKKEAATFPYPVWCSHSVQQPPAAKAFDVLEIPVKLSVNGLGEDGKSADVSVEVKSAEIPDVLGEKIAAAVLEKWKKKQGKKDAPWAISVIFEWVETNFTKMLLLDPDCVGDYEGCDENGATMRRYAIAPPRAPVEEESEEEEDSEVDEEAEAEMLRKYQELLRELDEPSGGGGKKKLSPEEIEAKKREASEMGEKAKQMSKSERAEMNKSRKEKSGSRMAKTGPAAKKFEGDGATSKEDKKKKNAANVAKRFGT